MTLEQPMAFTVNPHIADRMQVWETVKNSWNNEPYSIRRILTETSVRASGRRAPFFAIEDYEAADGVASHDTFQGDDGGLLEDPALLYRLIADKLQAEARRSSQRAGSGSRSQPTCPMAKATGCVVW